jgi:DNA-binding MarR family transcriptional regulator
VEAHVVQTHASTEELTAGLYALLVTILKATTPDMIGQFAVLDLSITQMKLLHALEGMGAEKSVKELAEILGISLPAASRAVDGLHQRDLVERREDEQDRRMKRVRIAPGGAEFVQRFQESRLTTIGRFAASLSPEESAALAPALRLLLERPDIAACSPKGSPG